MADKARKLTDQELKKLEKELHDLYNKSADDIAAKWYKYMESHEKKLNSAYNELQKAKKSNDKDMIATAQEKYERTVKNITLNNDRYKAMLNETTAKLAHVNEIALNYVNDEVPKIYTLNYNEFANQDIDGYDFTLVNERAIKNLFESDQIGLPPKKLDIPKDTAWNAKNINSQLMQGILQGESIPKIAKRLQNVTDMNAKSAIRNARTMVTGAENKGRQDSFKKAESDGVILSRKWIATHDERTRAWHSDLDGVEVGLDEPWENDYGDIMFPGDPTADPANVYNCRCSIRAIVKGFKWNQEDAIEEKTIDNAQVEHEIVNGKDISETWVRRPDQFAFEIEDVINAQGFDGLPRVVSAEEFDRYVQEANDGNGFIAQRTYSAPDQETLDAYREQLYNGKWYVDCSKGGAAHGKGMYCVGNNGTNVTETMKNSMISYGGMSPNANIETFTLDKTAKIIKENDIKNLYSDLGINLMKRNLDGYNFSDDEIKFIASYGGIGDANYVSEFLHNNSKRAIEIMQEVASNEKIANTITEYLKITNDNGVVASMFGYDAIECAGGQNYYVILNRTKVIFKGE